MKLKAFLQKTKTALANPVNYGRTAVLAGSVTLSGMANAAGLEKVNTIMQKVSDALQYAAAVTVTVAVFWAGYKIVFGGQTFREAAPILIGGIVIGAASQIASMLVGS